MRPLGPSTSGLLSTCSMYFAVAFSQASKPFFHVSQSMIRLSLAREAEPSKLARVRKALVGLVQLAGGTRHLSEALENETRLPLRRELARGGRDRDLRPHAHRLGEDEIRQTELAGGVHLHLVGVASRVRQAAQRRVLHLAGRRPRRAGLERE